MLVYSRLLVGLCRGPSLPRGARFCLFSTMTNYDYKYNIAYNVEAIMEAHLVSEACDKDVSLCVYDHILTILFSMLE